MTTYFNFEIKKNSNMKCIILDVTASADEILTTLKGMPCNACNLRPLNNWMFRTLIMNRELRDFINDYFLKMSTYDQVRYTYVPGPVLRNLSNFPDDMLHDQGLQYSFLLLFNLFRIQQVFRVIELKLRFKHATFLK